MSYITRSPVCHSRIDRCYEAIRSYAVNYFRHNTRKNRVNIYNETIKIHEPLNRDEAEVIISRFFQETGHSGLVWKDVRYHRISPEIWGFHIEIKWK